MRSIVIVVLATALLMAVGGSAKAYQRLMCGPGGGSPLGITSNKTFAMNRCSMPVGSVAEADFVAAVGAWNSLQGMADRFGTTGGDAACSITHGDGRFDVAVANRAGGFLGGANGIALYLGYTQTPQTCNQSEWDILIASDQLVTGMSDEFDISNEHRRGTMVHELGHVLGLGHETTGLNSIMSPSAGGGTSTSGPYGGRSAAGLLDGTQIHAPHADDTSFAYDFHNNGTSTDVAVNLWMRAGGTMVPATAPTILPVCDGNPVNGVSFTWHNRGTQNIIASSWSMVISTDEVVSTTDTTVLTGSAVGPKGWSGSATVTFTVPENIGTAAGVVMRVGVIADPGFALSESIENNNATRLPLILWVFHC